MSVLITGANGFIGKYLINHIKEQDASIDILKWDIEDGDLSKLETKAKLEAIKGVDKIIHLASNSFVPASWENTQDFIIGNYTSTFNILEYCRHNGASLTYISSYMYGNTKELPISEKAEEKVNNPYGFSKLSGEQLCKFYHDVFEVPVTIIRPFNIYGAGQNENFLIPYLAEQISNPAKAEIEVNDLNPRRDYLHVNDFCSLLYNTLKVDKDFELYNAGFGQSYSVEEVINLLQKIAGTNKKVNAKNVVRFNEINDVVADVSKAKKELNWQHNVSLEQGLSQVLNYYKQRVEA